MAARLVACGMFAWFMVVATQGFAQPTEDPTGDVATAEAEAHEPPRPRHRWIWSNLTAVRYNPLGLSNRFDTGYRLQLLDQPGDLYRDSFAAILAATEISPAFTKLGGRLELQPLAILNLQAQYQFMGGFGGSNVVSSFATPAAEYDDDTLDGLKDQNYAATGSALQLGALLQAKVWRIAVRNQFRAYRERFDLQAGDQVFYNPTLDIMVENDSWAVTNDADVIVFTDTDFKFAVRYSVTHAFYSDALSTGVNAAAAENGATHRLGPGVLWTPVTDDPGNAWTDVTVAFLSQWWLSHRYRAGADTSAAIPNITLALIQKGDFYP